ncbi:MAG: carbohydrate kinase family protein [Acidobacteria bacterium]|nr:carbohydrate kinase family protein [Acidobacteriota bacterium]
MKLLVVGNLVLDLLAWPVESIHWDGTVWVEQFTRSVGGNGANTSYTLAKMGASVALAGAVGRDEEGSQLIDILTQAGVDVSRVKRLALPTPTTMALVKKSGSRAFVHRPGASRESLGKVIAMNGFSHLHVANPFGVVALRKLAPEFLKKARAAGLTTSMDTGWDSRGEWGSVVMPCLEHVDVLFLNEDEAKRIAGASNWKAALKQLPAQHVVMKRGKRGVIVDGEHVAAFEVNAMDTTGAGDVFAGAFLAAWTRGYSLRDSAEFGNAAAAMSVEKLGSIAGVKNFKQTLRWMKGRNPSSSPQA